ncbi:MAG: tetratricopeptide repeat protein [Chloroflexi bacterium]|nr:tetratricopeptide repeat protein [Chloroflexota bacterium]
MPGNQEAFSAAMNAAERSRWDSQWAEASKEYQVALAEFPDDPTAQSGLGFCFMQMKQWTQALKEYESILKRDPSNVIALSKTAELYGILNRRNDAYVAYMHLAELYSQAGQGARAEAAWQKAVQLSSGNPEPHERLASYYFEKKEILSMIQQRLAAAQGYLQRNEPEAARAQCEEVLRADATNAQAQQLLTMIRGGAQTTPGLQSTGADATFSTIRGPDTGEGHAVSPLADASSGPLAFTGDPVTEIVTSGNTSGGNTGIMGNMGSAGNFGGVSNSGQSLAMAGAGGGMNSPRQRITASQVTGVLKQAQMFQTQGRFNDAIDLCEQILESGFDRPDARYFLGWLYQEQQRWDEAIRQFQMLLNDPDYALSCYYALGQCYRARGDLRTATVHFDEAVDRVNLDALTMEESDQLVQLCQEAAEAHRSLGEQEQALTVYNALLGFLRSRGWNDKVAQVEFMLQQAQNAPAPSRPVTPPVSQPRPMPSDQGIMNQPTQMYPPQPSIPEAPTMAFNAATMQPMQSGPIPPVPTVPPSQQSPAPGNSAGELPDWLTGILSDGDKTQVANPQQQLPPQPQQQPPTAKAGPVEQYNIPEAPMPRPPASNPLAAVDPPAQPASPSWLTEDVRTSTNGSRPLPPEPIPPVSAPEPTVKAPPKAAQAPMAPAPVPPSQLPPAMEPPYPAVPGTPVIRPAQEAKPGLEDLLNQIAGTRDEGLKQAAEALLASTASLPENVRVQVVRSMQDIQKYINHGLLTPATEECLRVIDMAPQYLDVHQVLGEIYVRQGKIEQAITKYAILVDTYVVNGRTDDAVATYRRILQLDPNNLTYRTRLINLLSTQGNKEDLLRERTLAAESYLRLGYMDRALTELEQALQESPTSVATRLNYALALHKLGRIQQAMAEYQRVLQVDPRNLTALVRWHVLTITNTGTPRAASLEVLTRIRWQLRGEGQKNADVVAREYHQAIDIYPNNADVHFALGQIHHQCGQFDKAIDAYVQAMRDNAVEVIARASAAQVLLSQGKPEAAIQQLELSLQSVRHSPSALDPATWAARPREEGEEHQAPELEISMQLAKAYGRTGRQEQMQAILRQVKQTKPAQDEVSSVLADISARNGDLNSTLQEYIDLVRHYRNSRQIDSAIGILNEMVRMVPQDARPHNELADIYINRGLLDEGIAELRVLADIYLRSNQLDLAASAIQRVGNIYAEMGNNDEALTNLCRAAELNPESMELLREVVAFCLQLGRNLDAATYQVIIARHYFETHQVKESVAALQQLITIDRNNFDAYDMLGQTYQSVGEYEQASRVYRNLAKMNPGSSIARDRLAALQELRTR